MRCVGACNVLPLNSMVEAAPQLHGYVNSCQYTVSNLLLRSSEGHLNLWGRASVWTPGREQAADALSNRGLTAS